MDTNFNAKADDLYQQAEKKVKGGFFKNLMGTKSDRLDEAKELYEKAGNAYKVSQNWEKAVQAYLKCADCEEEDGQKASYYLEAAHAVKKINTQKFIEYSQKAIKAFCMGTRISSAASLAKECGEKLEEEHDYEEAVKFYEKAAELYFTDETPTYGNNMLVKASDLSILTRDYKHLPKVIKNYEKVAQKYLNTPLIKTNAKDLFFKAALCFLANDDLIGCKKAINGYKIDDAHFDDSRELELIVEIIGAIEARDSDLYSKKVAMYTKMTPFDKVKSQLAAKIKDIYVPEEGVGAVVNRMNKLDFTGKDDDDIPKKKQQKQKKPVNQEGSDDDEQQQQHKYDEDEEEEDEQPKKKKFDFT